MESTWALLKRKAQKIAQRFNALAQLVPPSQKKRILKRGTRMHECATHIHTRKCPNCGDERVFFASFCRDRLCPICAWRRAKALAAKTIEKLTRIPEKNPQFVLITLTVQNVPWRQLKKTLGRLSTAWKKLSRTPQWQAVFKGYIKTLEITQSTKYKNAHPHIHALVHVSPDYFTGKDYITQAALAEMWRQALQVAYTPIVDIRKVKTIGGAVAEVAGYITKSTPIVLDMDDEDAAEYLNAIAGARLWSAGGSFRINDDEIEDNFITQTDQTDQKDDALICPKCGALCVIIEYTWNKKERDYIGLQRDGPA